MTIFINTRGNIESQIAEALNRRDNPVNPYTEKAIWLRYSGATWIYADGICVGRLHVTAMSDREKIAWNGETPRPSTTIRDPYEKFC